MFCGNRSLTLPFAVFLALLIIILPAGAYNVAMYGANAGLDPDLHKDTITVVRTIPGSAGSDLDNAVDEFTKDSVDIIVISGEDTFSPATAAKIEAAVAKGKILIVTFPSNRLFDASLPASNGGTSPGSKSIELANPTYAESKEIFAGLTTPFELVGAAPDKENSMPRSTAVTLLNFNDGMPALAYTKYGNGYVIQWTTAPMPAYMDCQTADTIVYRLITRLKPASATTSIPPATTQPAAIITTLATTAVTIQPLETVTPVATTPTSAPAAVAGDISVYSSPLGASILIDGKYYGTTPSNLTGVAQGSHIIRLALSGYYDYEGTIYVVPGQSTHAFGTLQPLNQVVTAAATAIPIIIPVATAQPTETAAKGLLDNSSIVVAIIGVVTAAIAAGATIFTHVKPPKKEE